MDKIHILYVGLDNAKFVGGIETYILKVVNHINLNIFQIDFLVFNDTEPCFYKELLAKGCKFHFVTSRKKNYWKNRSEIKELYKKEKFDIIHCHLNSLSYITPCIEAYKLKIPIITHSHNAAIIGSRISKILHDINFFRLKKLSVNRIAVSDLAGKWMFGNRDFLVLNNGIDTDRFLFSEDARRAIREEFSLDENAEVFINVGAFRPQKNHVFIVKLFAEYLKKNSNAILFLVGEGRLKDEIISQVKLLGIEKSVFFLGLRKDIPQLLSASDKLLFPSIYEGFPIALIEAECSGLQCIISNSITKQAAINDLCESVSLDDPIEKWLIAMGKKVSTENRKNASCLIKNKGLDVNSEIKRLSDLYTHLMGNQVQNG